MSLRVYAYEVGPCSEPCMCVSAGRSVCVCVCVCKSGMRTWIQAEDPHTSSTQLALDAGLAVLHVSAPLIF